jgi:hypothetical protein
MICPIYRATEIKCDDKMKNKIGNTLDVSQFGLEINGALSACC